MRTDKYILKIKALGGVTFITLYLNRETRPKVPAALKAIKKGGNIFKELEKRKIKHVLTGNCSDYVLDLENPELDKQIEALPK